jgi:hypothetical protein
MRERYRAFVRRAFDGQVQQDEEQFRAAQVPLYGLPPSFQGPRTLGKRRVAAAGWGARDRERPARSLIVATVGGRLRR